MNNLFKLIAISILAVGSAFAQLATTNTTLSAAIPAGAPNSGGNTVVQLASCTGTVLPSLASGQLGSILFFDREAVQIVTLVTGTIGGSGACSLNVKRGQLNTSAQYSHASGVTVWVGQPATSSNDPSRPFAGPYNGAFTADWPSGSCTRSAQYTLPIVFTGSSGTDTPSGTLFDCVAGIWVSAPPQINTINSHTSWTTFSMSNAIATTSVTDVAGKIWFSQLLVPGPAVLTGACLLNGATVTTDKHIYALYDAAGNLVANTALAGVSDSGASVLQCIPFTSTVRVYGPMTYYIANQGNGTTDNFQSYATNGAPTNYGTGAQTGVFGTLASITPSLTFTGGQGPIMAVY